MSYPINAYALCYTNPDVNNGIYTTGVSRNSSSIKYIVNDEEPDPGYWGYMTIEKGATYSGKGWEKQEFIDSYNIDNPQNYIYHVNWSAGRDSVSGDGESSPIIEATTYEIADLGDEFGTTKTTKFGTTTAIEFDSATLIKDDGFVKVYDGASLVKQFSKKDIEEYTNGKSFTFEQPIKSLKIVTSEDNPYQRGEINIKLTKSLDLSKMKEQISLDT